MSELIKAHDNRATIRWKLLASASALALTGYISSTGMARAEDTDHPVLWIELGGQMENVNGTTSPFIAPFMTLTPASGVYDGISFTGSQKEARFAFGAEGKISFQPENSDWIFSAGVRYGRSHAKRHTHKQIKPDPVPYSVAFTFFGYPYTYVGSKYFSSDALADTETRYNERHLILDFQAGKDVGLGLFGRNGSSTLSGGVRFASFAANSSAYITARPNINPQTYTVSFYNGLIQAPLIVQTFHQYQMHADAQRSFRGLGPSLSWSASAALLGDKRDGELTLDWGINASILFGKQKARTHHTTQAYHLHGYKYNQAYSLTYHHAPPTSTRSRSVTVPNIGGFAGLSLRWTNANISVGYRYDTFIGAMDTGIDTAKKSNATFNGPFASISVGLGD